MEWVEISARTVEEAKDQALDQLGVAEDEAEFEVLEEPRPGLFGRLRGQARVRAKRPQPLNHERPQPKVDVSHRPLPTAPPMLLFRRNAPPRRLGLRARLVLPVTHPTEKRSRRRISP
jgi:Jag N-terminus